MESERERFTNRIAELEEELRLAKEEMSSYRCKDYASVNEFLSDIFHNTNEGLIYTTLTGKVLAVNKPLAAIVEVDEQEIVGKNSIQLVKKLLSPAMVVKVLPKVFDVIAGKKVGPFEIQYKDKILEISSVINQDTSRIIGIIRDITEQQKTMKMLRESESFIKTLASASPNIIFVFDIALKQNIYCNRSISQLLGYKQTELQDTNPHFFHKMIHPDDLGQFDKFYSSVQKWPEDYVHNFEYRMLDKSGKWRWFRGSEKEFQRVKGKIKSLVGSVQEITTEKEAAEELRKSTQTFADLAQSIPSGLFIYQYVEPDKLLLVTGNPEAEKLTGINVSEWLGKEFNQIWPNAKSKGFTQKYLSVAKTQVAIELNEAFYSDHRLSGAFRIKVFPMPGSRLGVAFENITRVKQAEEKVKESEKKYQAIFNNAPVGIFRSSPEGRFMEVNPALAKMLGYDSPEELIKKVTNISHDVYVDSSRRKEIVSSTLQSCQIKVFESRYKKRDGQEFDALLYLQAVKSEDGETLYLEGMVEDISTRKRSEEALLESERKVRAKLEAVLLPEGDIASLQLADIVDVQSIQAIMDDFYHLTKIGVGIIDIQGKVLVGTGWQDICTKFHRVHPDTEKKCIESDLFLSKGIPSGQCKAYKCKNNLWDIATPIIIGGKHLGNLFLGQFHYTGEVPDETVFIAQAKKYKFNEKEYLKAMRKVPVWDATTVNTVMGFYMKFANFISAMSYSNIKLARTLEQHKLTVAALKQSEEKYRSITENTFDLIALLDLEGNYLYCNNMYKKILGYGPQELIGRKGFELVHPEDRASAVNLLASALAEKRETAEFVFRNIGKDGQLKWISHRARLLYDGSGVPEKILLVAEDITSEKRIEQQLLQQKEEIELNNERLESLLRISQYQAKSRQELLDYALSEAITLTNSKIGYIYFYNETTRQFTLNTWSKEVMKECEVANPSTMYDLDKTGCWGDAVRLRKPIIMNDYPRDLNQKKGTPKGHVVLYKFLTIPVFVDEQIVAVVGVANKPDDYNNSDIRQLTLLMDTVWKISERISLIDNLREAKEKAERSELKFRTIANYTYDWEYWQAPDGSLVFVSPSCHRITGYTVEEFVSRPQLLFEIVHPDDKNLAGFHLDFENLTEKTDCVQNFVFRLIKKDETIVYVEHICRPLINEDGKYIGRRVSNRDITERVRAGETMKSMAEMLDNAPSSIIVHDLNGHFLYANKKTFEMHGFSSSEFMALNLHQLDVPESEELIKVRMQAIEQKGWAKFEVQHYHKDGSTFPLEVFVKTVEWLGIPAFLSIATDISERKWAEHEIILVKEKVEASEELYRTTFEKAAVGVAHVKADGSFIRINQKFCDIVGYSREELMHINVSELTFPEDMAVENEFIRQVMENKIDTFSLEKRYIHKSGKVIWIKLFSNVIRDYQNRSLFAVASISDITEQKQLYEELLHSKLKIEESEFKLRGMFQNTHTGIIYFDKEGHIFDANPAVLRILGSPSLEDTKKINLLNYKPLIDVGFSSDILKCISSKDIVVSDVAYTSMWGKTVYMKYYLIPIVQNDEISGIWANLQDLTDLWNIQNDLVRAKEKAEESDRLKTAFLQNMSHEIRTPMNGIIGFSSLYAKPGLSPEKRERYADLVIKSSQQLLGIVNDILDISMMETGKIKLNSDEVPLNHLMDELYNLFKQKSDEKNLSLFANKPDSLPDCCIFTDYVRIKQVLTNLLNNAIKFTHQGKIEFGYEFSPQGIRFFVNDTGIGISKENQKKVFERFFQEESDISRQYGGNGLGLSISSKLVELLGGEMVLQSEKGKGSCFSFVLPVFCEQNLKNHTPVDNANPLPGNGITVLIAEDEEINFLYLNELLTQMGHKIIRAKNGKEAVEFCQSKQKPDVVLMDIKMPILNGYEATRQIRTFDANLPIIAHTAYARPEDKAKALEAGCNAYLSKPINTKDLVELLNKLVFKLK